MNNYEFIKKYNHSFQILVHDESAVKGKYFPVNYQWGLAPGPASPVQKFGIL